MHLPADEFITSTSDILLRRGQIHLLQGSWKSAAADFSRVIQITPDSEEAHYGYWKSNWAQSNYHMAAKSAQALLELSPDSDRSLHVASYTFAKTGQADRAVVIATRWEQLAPKNLDAKVNKAIALDAAGDDVQALALLNAILIESPTCKRAILRKGWMLLSSDQPILHDAEAALQLAETLYESGEAPSFAAGFLAGTAAAKLEDFPTALKWFKVARDHIKTPSQARSLKAIVRTINGRRPIQIAQPQLDLL